MTRRAARAAVLAFLLTVATTPLHATAYGAAPGSEFIRRLRDAIIRIVSPKSAPPALGRVASNSDGLQPPLPKP